MSEKVRLTKEQAIEFEGFKALRNSLEEWAHDRDDPNAPHSIIHELTFDQIARALFIGYEIEPEQPKFQPGDKVVRLDGRCFTGFKNIEIIESVKKNSITLSNCLQYTYNFIRHATPEEIYWLETLGREKVGDFKTGDIFVEIDGDVSIIGSGQGFSIPLDEAKSLYQSNAFFGIYPAESFKPFPKEESK